MSDVAKSGESEGHIEKDFNKDLKVEIDNALEKFKNNLRLPELKATGLEPFIDHPVETEPGGE